MIKIAIKKCNCFHAFVAAANKLQGLHIRENTATEALHDILIRGEKI